MAGAGERVAVVDRAGAESDRVDRVVAAVEAAGGVADRRAPEAVDDAVVVAPDEQSLLAYVRAGGRGPVVPVGAGRGVRSVPPEAVDEAVASLLAGASDRVDCTTLAVEYDGASYAALFDLMLVTTEPARISEYRVSADQPVARFRADGVVVASPAGSSGYAESADGPVIAPGTDVVGVVPIAPFVTNDRRWVLNVDDLALTVLRDEGDVSLLVDDREVAIVERDVPVRVAPDESVELCVVPESLARFATI